MADLNAPAEAEFNGVTEVGPSQQEDQDERSRLEWSRERRRRRMREQMLPRAIRREIDRVHRPDLAQALMDDVMALVDQVAKERGLTQFVDGDMARPDREVVPAVHRRTILEDLARHPQFVARVGNRRDELLRGSEYHGEFVNFDPIWSFPKPVQKGGPPILLGSEAKKGPERAVAYCDGWMPINRKPEQLMEGLKSLREAADRAGRKFESLTLGLFAAPGKEDAARRVMDMGFTHLIFPLPPAKADTVLPLLDTYGALAEKLRH